MRVRRTLAGLLAACLSAGSWGEALPSIPPQLPAECIAGYAPQAPSEAGPTADDSRLPPAVAQWLKAQRWQAGYTQWQRCRSGFGPQAACGEATPRICEGPADGLAFLAMHRHLLQSLRAAWPSYAEDWTSFRRWPERSDYPAELANRFTPWPSALLRAAQAVDTLRSMPRAQVLARWPSEGAFGQWLQCGSATQGKAVDSLYGALLANAGLELSADKFDSRAFWRSHAWIDRAWDTYRQKLGKTPEDPKLQALLLQQCQQHSTWAQRTAKPKSSAAVPATLPLFEQGALNPQKVGSWLSLVGEVISLHDDPSGRRLVLLDTHLLMTKPLWFSSDAQLVGIQPGDQLRVAGYLQPSRQWAPEFSSAPWLLAESIQGLR